MPRKYALEPAPSWQMDTLTGSIPFWPAYRLMAADTDSTESPVNPAASLRIRKIQLKVSANSTEYYEQGF